MLAIAPKNIIRNGGVVSAGTPFAIKDAEIAMALVRNWVLTDSPDMDNAFATPEKKVREIPGNIVGNSGEIPGMPNAATKGTSVLHVAPQELTCEPKVLTGSAGGSGVKMGGKVTAKVGAKK